ncbi:MAG: hypothetical protein GYA50_02720 [Eubacteriaceae bacterium]|nr:hypothetical protein [Eubacteriaceae bacterium]
MKKKNNSLSTIILITIISVLVYTTTSINNLSIKIILIFYTMLIVAALIAVGKMYSKINKEMEFNKLILYSEYRKLAIMLEQDEDNKMFGKEQDRAKFYIYFISNNYDKYIKAKKIYIAMDYEKEPEIYFVISNLLKITEMIFMYLHEEVDNANELYEKYSQKIIDNDKKLNEIDIKTWELLQVLKMIHEYNNGNLNEAKEMYKRISIYAYNNTVKTLISYYMCRIYEVEGNTEAIKHILIDTDIQNNPYGIYLNRWRVKQ